MEGVGEVVAGGGDVGVLVPGEPQAVALVSPVAGSFTVTVTLSEAVQPVLSSVTVTVYWPFIDSVAPVRVGFWSFELKLFGPLHA